MVGTEWIKRQARRVVPGTCGFVLVVTAACTRERESSASDHTIGIEAYPGTRDLYAFAEAQRVRHDLPALAVGILRDGRITGLGVAGKVKAGAGEPATLSHRFDVGSCTKSFTATAAARLVEQGALRWDSTINDCLPELASSLHPDYREVTLEMLLRHRAGLGQTMNRDTLWQSWQQDHATASATEQRRMLAADVLGRPPRSTPGSEEYYTNDAYLVAAAMMESKTGKTWEGIVRELLVEPLGLSTVTFGAPEEVDGIAVVWGHNESTFRRNHAIDPQAAHYGQPPFGSPAGFIHCSLVDLLRWVNFHIQSDQGGDGLLRPESVHTLHTPLADRGFGLGWEVEITRDGAGHVVERSIFHGGNAAGFRANMWFCPESRTGTVILYNHAGDAHTDDYVTIFHALLREFEILPDRGTAR